MAKLTKPSWAGLLLVLTVSGSQGITPSTESLASTFLFRIMFVRSNAAPVSPDRSASSQKRGRQCPEESDAPQVSDFRLKRGLIDSRDGQSLTVESTSHPAQLSDRLAFAPRMRPAACACSIAACDLNQIYCRFDC